MGWKGTLRSLNASAKRSHNESQKRQRSLQRSIDKIEKDANEIIRKARSFESELERDIMKSLNLKYVDNTGFTSRPFEIHTEIFELKINLTNSSSKSNDIEFSPREYKNDSVTVSPFDITITQWGTIIVFKVANNDENFRLRFNWFKKTDPASSPVYLVDTVNNQYYYPIATDLKGEVIFSHPRTGIMVFEPFLKPTESIQINFSNINLSPQKGVLDSFNFSYNDQNLPSIIYQQISKPKLVDQVKTALGEQEKKAKKQASKSHSSGCMSLIIIIVILYIIFSFLSGDDKNKSKNNVTKTNSSTEEVINNDTLNAVEESEEIPEETPDKSTEYTIIFKDGRRLDINEMWEENDQIKCKMYGSVVSFSKSEISKIETKK